MPKYKYLNHFFYNKNTSQFLTIDVLKCRPGSYKISIWISRALFSQEHQTRSLDYLDLWYDVSAKYHYGFLCAECDYRKYSGVRWDFIQPVVNMYTLVPTILGMDEVIKSMRFLDIGYGNFFVALLSRSGVQLCMRRIARTAVVKADYTCKSTDDGKYAAPARIWVVMFLDYNKQMERNEALPPPRANPFDRDTPISIPPYMAVIVVMT